MMMTICVSVAMVLQVALAMPRGVPNPMMKLPEVTKQAELETISELGQLTSLHVVGVTTHPSEDEKLIYADETAIYDFNKLTGVSTLLAGTESAGLIKTRESQDGMKGTNSFKYITKVISRSSGVFIFDYDRLRKMNPMTKEVTTLAILSKEQEGNNPVTGAVSQDGSRVYWSTTSGEGHFVMSMLIAEGDADQAELVTAGPTLIGYMELSRDDTELFLTDVQMNVVERVNVHTGEVKFIGESTASLRPGALEATERHLLTIDHQAKTIMKYALNSKTTKPEQLCSKECMAEISNPFDMVASADGGTVYILDTKPHPQYPTYQFFIKQLTFPSEPAGDKSKADFSEFLRFYSKWFAAN